MNVQTHRWGQGVIFYLVSLVFCFLTSQATSLAGVNLIINGDFELGNTGFTTDYTYSPTSTIPEETYTVDFNPHNTNPYFGSYGDHTTGAGKMMVTNGNIRPGVIVWQQSIQVVPNTNYVFSVWLSKCYPPSPAQLEFYINDISIGTSFVPGATAQWIQFSKSWRSSGNSTAVIKIVDLNTEFIGNDFAIDDIALVPASGMFYFNNFEGAVGSEWSNTSTDITPVKARRFLGQFGNETVSLALAGLPSHEYLTVSFDLFLIRSWDGNVTHWDQKFYLRPHSQFTNPILFRKWIVAPWR